MIEDPLDSCVDAGEFFRELNQRAALDGVPTAAAIAMTYRCNFNCVHCYAKSSARPECELPGKVWIGIIDQLVDAGSLFLLITGGEPLLHPEFKDIYLHAKKRGMLVTVFTNGSLVDDALIQVFVKYPPRTVEISLYGMSDGTCRETVGTEFFRETSLESVRALQRAGIRLALKTVVMKANRCDFEPIRDFAASLGLPFRFDVCITPRLDMGCAPADQRLPPAEAVAVEFSDTGRVDRWRKIHARKAVGGGTGLVYQCSAGRSFVFIGPEGCLHPCISATHRSYAMDQSSFKEAWERMCGDINRLQSPVNGSCTSCDKSSYCGKCAAFLHLESGDESLKSPYLCELGAERLRRLNAMSAR
jgi:MoaA/NifB/PqqE/SkfB family radical SAM enzyme